MGADSEIRREALPALGVDVGGTKIAAAVVHLDGTVLARHEVRTPADGDADAVFAAVCAAADGALAEWCGAAPAEGEAVLARGGVPSGLSGAIAGIGLASAGPIDPIAGTVSPLNIVAWRAFPLRDRLQTRFALPVRLFGDGIAIVIAEHWLGAARGHDNVLGMVVSTGVGGGLVLGGRVVFGATGNAGQVGHSWADPAGPPCACGATGCLEAVASGTSLARWYAEQRAVRGVGAARPPMTAAEVAAAARAGDDVARAAFVRAGTALGSAIASAVALLDLDVVVIGGGVGRAFDLFAESLDAAYDAHTGFEFTKARRVVTAELGADTGVLGAAAVVLHPDRYWTGA